MQQSSKAQSVSFPNLSLSKGQDVLQNSEIRLETFPRCAQPKRLQTTFDCLCINVDFSHNCLIIPIIPFFVLFSNNNKVEMQKLKQKKGTSQRLVKTNLMLFFKKEEKAKILLFFSCLGKPRLAVMTDEGQCSVINFVRN